ncbi:hypothetical protein [Winogradskyella tangerina]|uniref:hypothetical protein n=1 Tax=Winogradskyella tangerina TaxID=2023240 RepID=UPI000DBE72DB|nr:hypothetical protein [Winogradskyella tangerina]
MKKIKLGLLSFTIALLAFTSCTNNEPVVVDQQVTEESQSIITSLDQLSQQVDSNGNFSAQNNPAGNVVFDFCFDFVYPLTLSYNNGTTVTVNSLDELVDVIIASTNELYINGIAFPFDVEVYNDDSDAIEVVTINNEDEFIDLLDDCDFDGDDDCACYEVYDPVCVEVTDPNGTTFTITYPNECYAICDGFDEDDFIEDCEDDYYTGDLFCFEFVFPLDIVINGDTVVTVDSFEDLGNTIYDVYDFNFVYPFNVTVEGEIETIEDEDDFEDLLEDCFDDYDDDYDEECEECEDAEFDPVCIEFTTPNGVSETIVFPNLCYAICEGFSEEDVIECENDNNPNECEQCEDEEFDPVCIEITSGSGDIEIVVFPNMCFAECLGYDESNVVDCEDDNEPEECTAEDIADYLTECEWYAVSSVGDTPNEPLGLFTFNADGTVTVTTDQNDTTVTGQWEVTSNPSGEVFMFISLPDPFGGISSLDWTVFECSEYFIGLQSNNDFLAFENVCD